MSSTLFEIGARLALDRETVRSKSVDGHLHIAQSNMSKAAVDPYYGHEIPDGEKLGLNPQKVYYLLRDPDELAKAASSFNNLPILDDHVPVSSDAPQQQIVIGSTGTDAHVEGGYLRNSAVVWVQDAINEIENDTKKEWSCAYHYRADMTPGNFGGLRYDGIMRDMIGNHVALVEVGRAGRDVVVGDSMPGMHMKITSRHALFLHGALAALVTPKLAMDAKLDLTPAFAGVKRGIDAKGVKSLAGRVVKLAGPKLAQDAGIDVNDVVALIGALNGSAEPEDMDDDIMEPAAMDDMDKDDDMAAMDADDDMVAKIMAFLEGKLSDEDMAALGEMTAAPPMDGAEDETPDAPPFGKKPPAMDAALIARNARTSAIAEMNAIRAAERAVEPIVGKLAMAMDSADAVYRMALDARKVPHKGIRETAALAAMVALLPTGAAVSPIAMDHKTVRDDFRTRFPGATQLVGG
jgi:hypothetical protein